MKSVIPKLKPKDLESQKEWVWQNLIQGDIFYQDKSYAQAMKCYNKVIVCIKGFRDKRNEFEDNEDIEQAFRHCETAIARIYINQVNSCDYDNKGKRQFKRAKYEQPWLKELK